MNLESLIIDNCEQLIRFVIAGISEQASCRSSYLFVQIFTILVTRAPVAIWMTQTRMCICAFDIGLTLLSFIIGSSIMANVCIQAFCTGRFYQPNKVVFSLCIRWESSFLAAVIFPLTFTKKRTFNSLHCLAVWKYLIGGPRISTLPSGYDCLAMPSHMADISAAL